MVHAQAKRPVVGPGRAGRECHATPQADHRSRHRLNRRGRHVRNDPGDGVEGCGLSQGVAVFYFKRKENLLTETLRYHYDEYNAVWRSAAAAAGPDPLDRLIALVFADLDPMLCTPRNLPCGTHSGARPRPGRSTGPSATSMTVRTRTRWSGSVTRRSL